MTDDEGTANAQRDLTGGSLNFWSGWRTHYAAGWAKERVECRSTGMNGGTDFSLCLSFNDTD